MKRRLALALVLALAFLIGCEGEDSTGPTPIEGIQGQIVDASGNPLEGVSIGIVYQLDGYTLPGGQALAEKVQTSLLFHVGEATHVRVTIEDFAGQLVKVLVDEMLEAGRHEIVWRADDEDGQGVPAGVYYARFVAGEVESSSTLFFYLNEPGEFLTHPHTHTDSDGRFSIPLDLVPSGTMMTVTDEGGSPIGDFPISRTMRVMAVRGPEATMTDVSREVTLPENGDGAYVTLTFP